MISFRAETGWAGNLFGQGNVLGRKKKPMEKVRKKQFQQTVNCFFPSFFMGFVFVFFCLKYFPAQKRKKKRKRDDIQCPSKKLFMLLTMGTLACILIK